MGRFGNVMVGIVVELHVGQRGLSLSFRFLELFAGAYYIGRTWRGYVYGFSRWWVMSSWS